MNENEFQLIANELHTVLPTGWTKTVLYAEITENAYEIFYYCFVEGEDISIQCYKLPSLYEITEKQIDVTIDRIAAIIKKAYTETEDKWSVMTFNINSMGKFNVEYDYSDLSEGSYEFKKVWKDKYLII